jgi:hypothetical protein
MPFKRNIKRENILLSHWRQGDTVKVTSSLTNIPEGTISHYYARFNKNKDKYLKKTGAEFQELPRPSPFGIAAAGLTYNEVRRNTIQLIKSGDYAKARDYLQVMLLFIDFNKRFIPTLQNFNDENSDEVLQHLVELCMFKADSSTS